jgi:hypothetical protein
VRDIAGIAIAERTSTKAANFIFFEARVTTQTSVAPEEISFLTHDS